MAAERSFIVVILFTFSLLTGFDDIKFIFFVADGRRPTEGQNKLKCLSPTSFVRLTYYFASKASSKHV